MVSQVCVWYANARALGRVRGEIDWYEQSRGERGKICAEDLVTPTREDSLDDLGIVEYTSIHQMRVATRIATMNSEERKAYNGLLRREEMLMGRTGIRKLIGAVAEDLFGSIGELCEEE